MVRLLVDPNQVQSSSEFGVILSPVALRRLQSSWQFLFRKVILELMPADALAAHFHDVIGRPTKELYSVAGLLLIKEFMNWSNERAADSYMFDVSIQYALNLKPHQQSMCERSTCLPGQTGILVAGENGLCCGDGNGIATNRL